MAAGQLVVPYATPLLTSTGLVAAGGTLTVYLTGTTTLATLYEDVGLTTPITNPLTSNSAGRFTVQSTVIWASDAQAYDCILNFPDGSSLTFDNLFVIEAVTSTSGFAPINSPNFTGVPTAPTPATNDNSNKIATTAFVNAQNYAPLNSPGFSGVPTAPTAATGTNSTQLATTAFVEAVLGTFGGTLTPNTINVTLPGGLIVKAGQAVGTIGEGVFTTTFPTPFPNACVYTDAVLNNFGGASSTPTGCLLRSAPTTTQAQYQFVGFQSGSINPVVGYYWFALGY